jgi:hypothetical protein
MPSNSACIRPEICLLDVNSSGNRFDIELRFRTEGRYCCCEPSCHVPTTDLSWWKTFRSHIREVSDRDPPPMVIHVAGVVEPGALFDVTGASEGFCYSHNATEKDAQ